MSQSVGEAIVHMSDLSERVSQSIKHIRETYPLFAALPGAGRIDVSRDAGVIAISILIAGFAIQAAIHEAGGAPRVRYRDR